MYFQSIEAETQLFQGLFSTSVLQFDLLFKKEPLAVHSAKSEP